MFGLQWHHVSTEVFFQHLALDSIAAAGGYYARRFCSHFHHRVLVAVGFTLLSTLLIVSLVG
jgi:hypothetical protein